MVFFNYATMQMAAKIVYYGPGLCGKTTNLQQIYSKTSPGSRGEMVSLETETDRTLFFDLLPIDVGVIGGFKTRLQLYTVPGQVFYNTTRKLVLKGVDGIVFVADSQVAMLEANSDSLRNLRENLAEIGLDLNDLPVVIQLNKRDLPNIASVETMLDVLDPDRRFEHVEAIAASGTGVFETLKQISKSTLRTLRRRMTGEDSSRTTPASRPIGQFRVKDEHSRLAPASPVAPPAIGHAAPVASPTFVTPVAAASVVEPERESMVATQVEEEVAEVAAPPVVETVSEAAAPALDEIIATAQPEPELAPESVALEAPETAAVEAPLVEALESLEAPAEAPAEEPAAAPAEVKTVKVRNSVDVMAELESLRKRATGTTTAPKASRRDPLADLAALRPKRDLNRTLHLELPADLLLRSKAVRVTLSFEDGEQGVVETREQQLELGDTADAQSLSVNLKIDLA
jgi:hypothetical protein